MIEDTGGSSKASEARCDNIMSDLEHRIEARFDQIVGDLERRLEHRIEALEAAVAGLKAELARAEVDHQRFENSLADAMYRIFTTDIQIRGVCRI